MRPKECVGLEEVIRNRKAELDRFESAWRALNATYPDLYPMKKEALVWQGLLMLHIEPMVTAAELRPSSPKLNEDA